MYNLYVMRKVRIRTIRGFCCANLGSELLHNNPRIAHANLGSARTLLESRNQTSTIRVNKPTIDRARKAARPSVSTKPQSITHAKSIVGLLPRMAEVWLRDPRRLRADPRSAQQFAQQILGSEVCMRDPRIIVQSSDPRFAQQNPRMVRIRTLRITHIYIYILYIPSFFIVRLFSLVSRATQ